MRMRWVQLRPDHAGDHPTVRHLGVEPLGLLRWADIDTDGLAEALESGFAGIGQPDQTALETTGGALDE